MTYTPFTYLLGWSALGLYYYGRRTAKNCHPSQLWKTYFSSSTKVSQVKRDHGDPDIIVIRRIFPNRPDLCTKWENKVLRRLNVARNPKWLNRSNGDAKFDTTGLVLIETEIGARQMVSCADVRYTNGSLVPAIRGKSQKSKNKGTLVVKDTNGKCSRVSITDEQYRNGTLVPICKGKVPVRVPTGEIVQVDKTDPRYVSGLFPHMSAGRSNPSAKGKVRVRNVTGESFVVSTNDPRLSTGELIPTTKGVTSKLKGQVLGAHPTLKCPHCGKEGGDRSMKRWHFSNCKINPNNM